MYHIRFPPTKKKYPVLFPSKYSLSPPLWRAFPSIGLLCARGITPPTHTTEGNGNGAPPKTRAIRMSACRRVCHLLLALLVIKATLYHSSDPHDDFAHGAWIASLCTTGRLCSFLFSLAYPENTTQTKNKTKSPATRDNSSWRTIAVLTCDRTPRRKRLVGGRTRYEARVQEQVVDKW